MLVDDFLPTYDVSDGVAVLVEADVANTWAALMEVDLIELGRRRPLIAALGGLRILPEIVSHALHGEELPAAPAQLVLRDTATAVGGGWVLLGELPNDEIALGLVGKFWRPVIEYAHVEPGGFRDFASPGFAKTVYSLAVRQVEADPARTMLSAVMRTATTDEHARRWFRRYWTFGVGSGAHVLATGLAEAARDAAESRAAGRTP
jgi:hypothetical protein